MALNLVNSRTGVSTWVKVVRIACRVSHLPRFRAALRQWVGAEAFTAIVVPWDVFCAAFELYQEADDAPFTIDNTSGEPIDSTPGA